MEYAQADAAPVVDANKYAYKCWRKYAKGRTSNAVGTRKLGLINSFKLSGSDGFEK